MLDRLLEKTHRLSRVAVWVAGALLIFAAIMVSVDVILRKLFSISMAGADEITGHIFAIGTAWAFTFTLLERANVRIDALHQLFPRL
ncbi:MAG: TRAP transporter small permease subunit, partial [SAR324 cluster bacterium]|nr:TRAP transporter small permease subunit [SAR324 cluster bacterium]